MALTTIPSELSSVSGISDSSTSTAITINSSQEVTFAGNITTGSNTISGVLSSVTGSIGSAATATTQAASDNSTKLATTAYVTTALANLVDSAPSTLDTLNELAAALGDDANFSTTVTNSIAAKAALAGATFTGTISQETATGGFLTLKRLDTTTTNNVDIGAINFEHTDSDDAGVPATILVSGDGTAGGAKMRFFTGTPSSKVERLTIDKDGNVGIGTSTPGSYYSDRLVVDGGAEDGITIVGTTTGRSYLMFADGTSGNAAYRGYMAYQHNDDSLELATGASVRATIDSSGNITQAGGDLIYDGSINWDIKHQRAGQSIVFSTTPTGGSTTAVFRIGADGDVFSVTAGTGNARYGEDAGNSIAAGGNYNTLIGNNAGASITTGDSNVAIGRNALDAEVAGSLSVAVGVGTLTNQNTGTNAYNTAVGHGAGNAVTTGKYNTFLGGLAGDSDTTGERSTAVGYSALQNQNFTGGQQSYNTAMGFHAAYGISTGIQNTIIGGEAGDAISTGTQNTAVGAFALSDLTTGNYNVAVGREALKLLSGATNYTIGIGRGAGMMATTTDNCVWIGGNSGPQTSGTCTGNNNVGIGYSAQRGVTTGHSNIGIGPLAQYNLSDGVRNVAMGMGAMENGNVQGEDNVAIGHNSGNQMTSGSNNTVVGAYAGDAINTGSENVAVGHSALGAVNSGSHNIGIGYQAGDNLTDGHTNIAIGKYSMYNTGSNMNYNVAIGGETLQETSTSSQTAVGFRALRLATSGQHNTAVGYESMEKQVTGVGSTCVGKYAGKEITGGGYNTMVGYGAGQNVGTSSNNTCIGYYTGFNNTQSEQNVFVGSQAGISFNPSSSGIGRNCIVGFQSSYYNTTGTRNTMHGYRAGFGASSTSASNNTGIGCEALGAIQTGYSNTALGSGAGGSVTTGLSNVCIGQGAGSHNIGLSTGSNNIIIGAYSDTSAGNSDTQVVVGYDVTSQGNSTFTTGKAGSWVKLTFGSTTVSSSSDVRLKENIQDSTAGLSFIKDLRPVTFEWKKAKDIPEDFRGYDAESEEPIIGEGGVHHGFIAQEVKTAIDSHDEIKDAFDMWSENHEGVQQLGESALIPVLVKAMQEQQEMIEALQAEVAALKGE